MKVFQYCSSYRLFWLLCCCYVASVVSNSVRPHRCLAAHQAPPSLGFSRQEHWSGLPFPSPMHEREKWKGSRSVVSSSQWPHGLQPTRLLRPRDFPGKSTGVGCHCLVLPILNGHLINWKLLMNFHPELKYPHVIHKTPISYWSFWADMN